MTTPNTQQYTDLVQQSQEAVLSAIDAWTKTVQEALTQVPTSPADFDADKAIDQAFDFTEKLLEVQRTFTKKMVGTGTAATEAILANAPKAAV